MSSHESSDLHVIRRDAQRIADSEFFAPSTDDIPALAGAVVRLTDAVAERDAWIRSWNRMEAAISHHKKNKADMFVDEVDEALYAARDRILKERASA